MVKNKQRALKKSNDRNKDKDLHRTSLSRRKRLHVNDDNCTTLQWLCATSVRLCASSRPTHGGQLVVRYGSGGAGTVEGRLRRWCCPAVWCSPPSPHTLRQCGRVAALKHVYSEIYLTSFRRRWVTTAAAAGRSERISGFRSERPARCQALTSACVWEMSCVCSLWYI